jgi:hypothetical protein
MTTCLLTAYATTLLTLAMRLGLPLSHLEHLRPQIAAGRA